MSKDHLQKFTIHLPYKLPLNWPALLAFFRLHQIPGVELIDDDSYARSFSIKGITGFFKVKNVEKQLLAEIWAQGPQILPVLEQKMRDMFDLDLELDMLEEIIKQPLLSPIYQKYAYLRIPGGFELFETIVNTILSQLVSVSAARKLVAKLVISYGERTQHPETAGPFYLFPTPLALQKADLANLGITKIKLRAIKELASQIVAKQITLEGNEPTDLKQALLAVPGIGPWTVEYVKMRCFIDKQGFPEKDLILGGYLAKYPEFKKLTTRRAYLAIYLWQHFLDQKLKT